MISLLHPSRSRFQRSVQTTDMWLRRAGLTPVELIVSVDQDDAQINDYLTYYGNKVIVNAAGSNAVTAVNAAAAVSHGDILVVLSDDTTCPEHWADKLEIATEQDKDCVIRVADGVQAWLITMPVLTRGYYMRFGYIYHPGYKHMFCDTEFTHIADAMKKVKTRQDLVFKHEHYTVMRTHPDELNRRNDQTWNHGKELYLKRLRENFGITGVNFNDITDGQHREWVRQHI